MHCMYPLWCCCCCSQVCSKFIIRHQHLHERIREKLVETMDAQQTSKAKSNIIYVVHDVIKSVRAVFTQKERNVKMHESPLVVSLGKILYTLAQMLPEETRHCVRTRLHCDDDWIDYLANMLTYALRLCCGDVKRCYRYVYRRISALCLNFGRNGVSISRIQRKLRPMRAR